MSSYQKQDAWKCIAIWYRQASGGQDPLLREHLNRIDTEREELYRCTIPEGIRVPILVFPAEVEDGVPEEAEISQAVRGLKGGRAGGLSGIRAEDLIKGWLQEASRDNNLVRRQWRLLVRLIQRTSKDGVVPE